MASLDPGSIHQTIHEQLRYFTNMLDAARQRHHELKRKDYYRNVKTVCFCSDDPQESEFAQAILAKRYFHGKMLTADTVMLPMVAAVLGKDQSEVYQEREGYRKFWDLFSHHLHQIEPEFMFLNALSEGPVISGLRSRECLKYGHESGLLSLSVWIESQQPRKRSSAKRSRYAITRDDCDLVISSSRTKIRQIRKIEKLGNLIYAKGV